jgi:hypothetical protein
MSHLEGIKHYWVKKIGIPQDSFLNLTSDWDTCFFGSQYLISTCTIYLETMCLYFFEFILLSRLIQYAFIFLHTTCLYCKGNVNIYFKTHVKQPKIRNLAFNVTKYLLFKELNVQIPNKY